MRGMHRLDLRALERGYAARTATVAFTTAAPAGLRVEPALSPRDEAAFWLTAAAEIEHALMVQYLFGAYSLDPNAAGPQRNEVLGLQQRLLQIAREEMGHLMTVQNLLHVIGAPLHLGREHSPYASQIYPFRFKLERLSLDSLAKYVVAESPVEPGELDKLDPSDRNLLEGEIASAARRSNDGYEVKHVGPIYHRLKALFADELKPTDFRLDRADYQARWADWGYEAYPGTNSVKGVLVASFDKTEAGALRDEAVAAIMNIGDQGEAVGMMPNGTSGEESHFRRFLDTYKSFKGLEQGVGARLTWPVARNPNTSEPPSETPPAGHMAEAVLEMQLITGRITNPRTRRWAQLFDLRYRLLLGFLLHALHRKDAIYEANGDRTARGLLHYWTFSEMRRIKKLAEKLVQMPKDNGGTDHAGPPFELPYTLELSFCEADRWRTHADVLQASRDLLKAMRGGDDADDPFLQFLEESDRQAQDIASALAGDEPVPQQAKPSDYLKAVTILDEAVRGFDIAPKHQVSESASPLGAFWRGRSRDDFVRLKVFGASAVVPGDPGASELAKRISRPAGNGGRMPRYRPRIADERIGYVTSWIQQGATDNTPPNQQLPGEPSPRPEPGPAAGDSRRLSLSTMPQSVDRPSFAQDIKPLFRDFDRDSMLAFGLDLYDYQNVKDRAADILARLSDGTMPCDGAWTPDRIELFKRWIDGGTPA